MRGKDTGSTHAVRQFARALGVHENTVRRGRSELLQAVRLPSVSVASAQATLRPCVSRCQRLAPCEMTTILRGAGSPTRLIKLAPHPASTPALRAARATDGPASIDAR